MECRILFHDNLFNRFDWCRLDDAGAESIDSGSAAIDEIKEICAGSQRVSVFVAQQYIHLTSPQLSPKAGKQQLNAIGYSIEEMLAQDVEDSFFAIAAQRADHSVPVAVVKRELMDELSHCLSRGHINARYILPQIYLCPWSDEADLLANLLPVEGGYLIRYGEHRGLFCREPLLKPLITLLLAELPPERRRLEIYGECSLSDDDLDGVTINRQAAVDLLARPLVVQSAINLKQKEYQSTHQWFGLIKHWQWPMVAMLLLGLVFVAASLLDGLRKEQIYNGIIAQQQALIQQYLPDRALQGDPKRQLIVALSDSAGSEGRIGFVDLLYEYSSLKKGFDSVISDRIQYQQSQLLINLETRDLKSLESFRDKLATSRFLAQIENVSINPDKTTGRLVMREK